MTMLGIVLNVCRRISGLGVIESPITQKVVKASSDDGLNKEVNKGAVFPTRDPASLRNPALSTVKAHRCRKGWKKRLGLLRYLGSKQDGEMLRNQ